MSNELVLGVAIGLVVGFIEGINLNILFVSASSWRDDQAKVLQTLGQLVAIPGFVLGGPFLTGALLTGIDPPAFASPYVVTMAVVLVGSTYRAAMRLSDAAAKAWPKTAGRPRV